MQADEVAVVISGGRGTSSHGKVFPLSSHILSLPYQQETDAFKPQLDAEGNPTSVRALIRTASSDMRLLIPVEKKSRVAPKHFLKNLKARVSRRATTYTRHTLTARKSTLSLVVFLSRQQSKKRKTSS